MMKFKKLSRKHVSVALVVVYMLAIIPVTLSVRSITTNNSTSSSKERAVTVAYGFLSEVVGISIAPADVKNVSTLSIPNMSNRSEQDYECVDIYLINNTRLSMLVRVGGGTPTLDNVVRYSVWTNDVKTWVDVNATSQTFLQRLIESSVNYVTVYQRALEVMEEVGIDVGAEAWHSDMLYTVSSTEGKLVLMWSRAMNGIPSIHQSYWIANNIQLSIDPEVGVVFLGNTWDKYEMVSNEMTITTSEEAVTIALSNLDEDRQQFVNSTEAELLYYSGEGRNPSSLYPCWRVEINYNETLPSNVTNHITYIWADTGHVWYNLDQGFYSYTSNTLASSHDIPTYERTLGVNASQHIHSVLENVLYIDQNFSTANSQDIIASPNNDAIFFIGHGGSTYVWNWAGWIWYYEQQWFVVDSNGNYAYDKDIYSNTTGDANFVFFWACWQAETIGGWHWSGTPYGMPLAYSNTTDLSDDGYHDPDYGEFAFLGFRKPAPFLSKDIEAVVDAGYHFVIHFYDIFVSEVHPHASINSALDTASIQFGG